jgi:chromosome segregation ATPase
MNHLADSGARPGPGGKPRLDAGPDAAHELELLRTENDQLRALCAELEQALQEATAAPPAQDFTDERAREYEALIEEKTEMIRQLHQQVQQAHGVVAELEAQIAAAPTKHVHAGPTPREEELLALSEELEQERRQLQEDEQTLMDQMRQMEVSMARERAEMARQRNDLQRLQSEVRHELERLERNGAAQSKLEGLKSRLQDATARRGQAPSPSGKAQQAPQGQAEPAPEQAPPSRKDTFIGRLFGR